jgi:hypothetical protein
VHRHNIALTESLAAPLFETMPIAIVFWRALQLHFGNAIQLNGHPEYRLLNTLNVDVVGRVGADLLMALPQLRQHRHDLGFTEVTIAALVDHSKGSVTSEYIHTLDTALIMAADTIAGYIQDLLDGKEFKQTAYALDRDSRKAALARFLREAEGEERFGAEEEPLAAWLPDVHQPS